MSDFDLMISIAARLNDDRVSLQAEVDRQRAEIERLRAQLNAAVTLLAEWSHAVDDGGAGWDCWDTHYKEARWGKGSLRSLIDEEIAKIAKLEGKP